MCDRICHTGVVISLAFFKEAWGEGSLEGCVDAIVELSR